MVVAISVAVLGASSVRRGCAQPAGRDGWNDVIRAIDRLPSQLGRVRVQIDRLVSPDFAVGAESLLGPEPFAGKSDPILVEASRNSTCIEAARSAQERLRDDLLDRCKCVRNWIRGIGLGTYQTRCIGSRPQYYLDFLVDGEKMSDEAREMIPPFVGPVPVRIWDIGAGMVPLNVEIVSV